VRLALGTVQFGLAYGVAGNAAAVPETEVRAILARASALGIDTLDTAPAYGDIEERLAGLMGEARFSVVTKVPALPADVAESGVAAWVGAVLERSFRRLGDRIGGVLFHHAPDLFGPLGPRLWEAAAKAVQAHGARLGASCYDVATLRHLQARYPIVLAQVPGNAFDQGLCGWQAGAAPPAVHIRSAFLQGLLLLPEAQAAARVPKAAAALARWHAWCRDRALAPLAAALAIAKGLPGATHCLVGVDSADQLEAVASAWQAARPLAAPELATRDGDVIDPRCWPPRVSP
jgi:aryl-alcohol dehydrogenase-like predicted oxidoreductase